MSRSRLIFYGILGLGLLIVGSQAVFASSSNASLATTAAAPTTSPDRNWSISGTIQAMNGEFWNIQGFAIRVTSVTHISGDLPTIGSFVRAQGTVQPDGTWLATDVHIGSDSLSATPTSVPTSTSTPTPTPTAQPTATATPTEVPDVFERLTPHATPPRASDEPDHDAGRPGNHVLPTVHPIKPHHERQSGPHDPRRHEDVRGFGEGDWHQD